MQFSGRKLPVEMTLAVFRGNDNTEFSNSRERNNEAIRPPIGFMGFTDYFTEFTLVPLSHHLWRESVASHEVSEA